MFKITLKNISKKYTQDNVLSNLCLEIPEKSFFVLLGPSGCGKTTILRLIGGFEYADSGDIFFGSTRVTDTPPHERHVNTVFQNYALFPHLNVYDNIAFGLKIKDMSSLDIRKKVDKLAESFGITRYLYKSIKELSGGEQQRVAVARAIANEPSVLLLDEPISALDFKLREKTLRELSELQAHLEMTFVYVTHDQFEALTVATHIAVINSGGIIEQIGTPYEIYEKPKSLFVAQFIGKTNIFNAFVEGDMVTIPEWSISFANSQHYENGAYKISVRPEKIFLLRGRDMEKECIITGTIKNTLYYGSTIEYGVLGAGGVVRVLDKEMNNLYESDTDVTIGWDSKDSIFFKN